MSGLRRPGEIIAATDDVEFIFSAGTTRLPAAAQAIDRPIPRLAMLFTDPANDPGILPEKMAGLEQMAASRP